MFKKIIYLIFVSIILSCNSNKISTQLTILGTMHFDTENFTSDSIFQELKRIMPDIILIEADSSDFSNNFTKMRFSTTETIAALKYQKEIQNVILRPFDYEGKNDYSMNYGIGDGNSYRLLNMLNNKEMFTGEQQKIWSDFVYYTNIVDSIGYNGTIKELNSIRIDSIVEIRQKVHYIDNLKIINQQESFKNNTSTTKLGDTISFRESSIRTATFWNTRNNAMVDNILNTVKVNPESKIVVLTGFQHRYYLMNKLKERQSEYHFKLK